MEVVRMEQRERWILTPEQHRELWQRWKAGESLSASIGAGAVWDPPLAGHSRWHRTGNPAALTQYIVTGKYGG
jgi:hypothetical protein